MKFSFTRLELSNWKGQIGEKLIDLYIRGILIPKLKNEGFNKIFRIKPDSDLLGKFPLSDPIKALLKGQEVSWESWERWCEEAEREAFEDSKGRKEFRDLSEKVRKSRVEKFRRDQEFAAEELPEDLKLMYLYEDVCPAPELLEATIKLLCMLKVWPDGILFKTRSTGKTIIGKEAYKLSSFRGMDEKFPIVQGELEIIEIKVGRSKFRPGQIENYAEVVAEGYPLRYFYVEIISFEKNQFEIEERLITDPNEIKYRIRLA